MGTATKRSKRGSDSWLRAEDGSWVPESELDVSRPKPGPRQDTVLPLNKLVRTMSLEVPDKIVAPSVAPAASAEPSSSFNNVWQRRPDGEGFTTVDAAAADSEVLEVLEVLPPVPVDRAQTPPLPGVVTSTELSALPPLTVKSAADGVFPLPPSPPLSPQPAGLPPPLTPPAPHRRPRPSHCPCPRITLSVSNDGRPSP